MGKKTWKNLLANALNAVEVVTFDYPYINGRRKAAPKPEKLVGFHSDIVRNAAAKYPGHPLILAGKSLGSRISCMVAAETDIDVSAVVCLGYPLKVCLLTRSCICLLGFCFFYMFVFSEFEFLVPFVGL
ncbi:putative KAT8 regulatory NSL complex subunit 3/Testis-expressed sequence 30 protein [Helianthus annuus]|nr:putative KAT8 regulatory NSL complex subunit 3/Testis-expressed sequence 30 protein [Helianthus annuus]KAJ0445873.1 putative KAT8 regulatory NSL complex subunit 3/Testis-expressed sequence 30 protein [Helianthus annuus]KAJ0630839.1 putative KAT8 regulatory NSL complex subunit 3/Testis-expressed sequence 30 protein [Helianthus annuus]KAJ0634698.1 putative KAT8 regulatory NSL complex subunit 3/Testis-expressed sequence 30 protein [Helianthus annuus]